jgi:hypothetical protein
VFDPSRTASSSTSIACWFNHYDACCRGKTEHATEGDIVEVTFDTKNVIGVECVVVDDRVTEDGELTEHTYDWYAQDKKGIVWYFGEDSNEYENGKVKSTGARGRPARMGPNRA